MKPVIVLCGGKGERLRSMVSDRPKALAPVGDSVFLGHLLGRLLGEGATQIVLSTGYKADQIAEYVQAHRVWETTVSCIAERDPLGTGGALAFAAARAGIKGEFLALNGDTWFDGALDELEQEHNRNAAVGTISLVAVADATRYGRVEVDEADGRVLRFVEKSGAIGPAWVNAGQYLLNTSMLRLKGNFSLERDILPRYVGKGLHAKLYTHATFLDIGTPEDYARAESLLRET
jgi:NDP-sugar pyrophosphorylase family protein